MPILRTLFLEDSATDAELIVQLLERAGFRLDWQRADSEKEFLLKLDPPPELILADFNLPQFDAIRALQHLRERNLDIPVVVVTGALGDEPAAECMKQGAADYLLKDRLTRLPEAVRRALEQRAFKARIRRDEERLRASEARFRELADNLQDVFWMSSRGRKKVCYVSPAFEKIWGRPADGLYDNSWEWCEAIHEEDRERVRAAFCRHDNIGAYDETYRIMRPDGSMRWIRDRAFPVRTGSVEESRVVGIAEDVTERRAMELNLQETQERFQQVFSEGPIGIALVGPDSQMSNVNRALCDMLGYQEGELIGRRLSDIINQGDVAIVEEMIGQLFSGLTSRYQAERRYKRKDGSLVWGAVTASLVKEQSNAPHYIIGVVQDITQRKRAEEAAQRAAENVEQFAYAASHDLQEPLRTVRASVQMLANRYHGQLDPQADEFIQFALDGAKQMGELVQALLLYSRSGQVEGQLSEIDLAAALQHATTILQGSIQASGALIQAGPLPRLTVDSRQIAQLFQNLIGNALKYRGPEPPRIEITASQQGKEWMVSVTDNGIGIEPRHLESIFGLFERLHGRNYPGTGIGLAICKKIVERHGGRIWAESEPGHGAVFKFTLPLGTAISSAAAAAR